MSTPAELHRQRLFYLREDLRGAHQAVINLQMYDYPAPAHAIADLEKVLGEVKASIFRMTIAGDISADAVGAHKMKRLAP